MRNTRPTRVTADAGTFIDQAFKTVFIIRLLLSSIIKKNIIKTNMKKQKKIKKTPVIIYTYLKNSSAKSGKYPLLKIPDYRLYSHDLFSVRVRRFFR